MNAGVQSREILTTVEDLQPNIIRTEQQLAQCGQELRQCWHTLHVSEIQNQEKRQELLDRQLEIKTLISTCEQYEVRANCATQALQTAERRLRYAHERIRQMDGTARILADCLQSQKTKECRRLNP